MRRRLVLILLTGAMLLPNLFERRQMLVPNHSQTLRAAPIGLVGRRFGVFTIAEAWQLTSANTRFGGDSSLQVTTDRRFTLLSDGAVISHFQLSPGGRVTHSHIWPLPLYSTTSRTKTGRDSESMTLDAASGRIWVGFEQYHRIMRFAPEFRRTEAEVAPPAIQGWDDNGGAEAMVRLADGRFLVLAETSAGPGGGTDALLFAGDPAAPATPPPLRFAYDSAGQGRVTDAAQLPDGRLLLLHRRIDVTRGWVSSIALANIADVHAGRVWRSRPLGVLERPLLSENFEGIAVIPTDAGPQVWIVSDDNRAQWQRTLLLRLDWAARPASR